MRGILKSLRVGRHTGGRRGRSIEFFGLFWMIDAKERSIHLKMQNRCEKEVLRSIQGEPPPATL